MKIHNESKDETDFYSYCDFLVDTPLEVHRLKTPEPKKKNEDMIILIRVFFLISILPSH